MNKKEAEEEIDRLTIVLDRLIKLSELIPEETDRNEMNELINEISILTQKYL